MISDNIHKHEVISTIFSFYTWIFTCLHLIWLICSANITSLVYIVYVIYIFFFESFQIKNSVVVTTVISWIQVSEKVKEGYSDRYLFQRALLSLSLDFYPSVFWLSFSRVQLPTDLPKRSSSDNNVEAYCVQEMAFLWCTT